ncbi:unnamed protein product [Ectocarpus sp. 6 AP-2014]
MAGGRCTMEMEASGVSHEQVRVNAAAQEEQGARRTLFFVWGVSFHEGDCVDCLPK